MSNCLYPAKYEIAYSGKLQVLAADLFSETHCQDGPWASTELQQKFHLSQSARILNSHPAAEISGRRQTVSHPRYTHCAFLLLSTFMLFTFKVASILIRWTKRQNASPPLMSLRLFPQSLVWLGQARAKSQCQLGTVVMVKAHLWVQMRASNLLQWATKTTSGMKPGWRLTDSMSTNIRISPNEGVTRGLAEARMFVGTGGWGGVI